MIGMITYPQIIIIGLVLLSVIFFTHRKIKLPPTVINWFCIDSIFAVLENQWQ